MATADHESPRVSDDYIKTAVEQMLRRDSFENYSNAEAAVESVQSELEARYDLDSGQTSLIGDIVTTWYESEA